ncbi:hypothetical protein QYE76_040196 [Lolium multiflorum]|uniref:CCHC-type domain-containing protein n=1 Tax=Lolium multiflorum TaxID=4521 RepID=A0AAD8TCC6_LOLMU|nr:hypothetical protein QYE76_040196 [Lolium multiflorum]
MAPPNRNANPDALTQILQQMLADREVDRTERQANLAVLQQLAQNNQGHGNHDHPGSKLKNFQNTNPPVFSKTEEPLDADDWLQTMENNLEVAGVEEDDKVLFATHYLAGPARAWWTSARALNAGQLMTWADFKLKFSKYHVPPGLIKKMRDEFRELKQGRLTVVEYRDRFLTLSRNNRPPTQMSRPGYQNRSGGNPRTGGHHHNSNNFVHHNNNFNRAPTRAPANPNTNTAPRTGSNAIPVAPKDKSTINCYECGVVGHYSKECPQRLAKMAANTTGPAQQQRRVANNKKFAPNNPNNRSGRLFHMSAEEAQEAPDVVLAIKPAYKWPPLKPVWKEVPYPSNWSEVGESQVFGPDILREAEEKVHKIREYLKTAQSRQKSYADKRRREMTFEIGDFVSRAMAAPSQHLTATMSGYK